MANEVKLPRLGQGMESGTIVRWLKNEGDAVAKGEPLYELDTDKVTQEVEADVAGTLVQIVVREGEVAVGTTIALIGEAGEAPLAVAAPVATAPAAAPTPAAVTAAPAAAAAPAPAPAVTAAAPVPHIAPPAVAASGRVKASPLARRIARERGIELASVVGTGPDGRIVAEDVERTASGAPAPARAAAAPATAAPAAPLVAAAGVTVEPLSGLRRTIARRLTEAWQAPAFQISLSADMGRVVALRKQLVARTPDGAVKPTVSDVITKLVALALVRHPAVNALWAGDSIHRYGTANIGIAVAVPNGLVVPVIRSAELRSIADIATERSALVERARAGKLTSEDMGGGTFSISNLGMFGIETFIAVLNPPQAAILAVGAIQDTPVARDGQVVIRPMLSLTLTCDHRALDGATAAEFLSTVKTFLEEPGLAL